MATLERLTLYHGAVGDCAMVHTLLSQDIDPNIQEKATIQDRANMSLMHYAAQYGYLDIVNMLLEHPAFITTQIAGGENSPLYLAMKHNQHAVIKQILQTCNVVNGGQALCYANKKKILNVVHTLLVCKIDAKALYHDGLFPLWHATLKEIFAYLT